jgi:hypothetical protein
MRNWKTSFFGGLLAASMALSQFGVKIGRVGQGDYVGLAQVIAAVGMGWAAKDKNVTGGTVQNDQ